MRFLVSVDYSTLCFKSASYPNLSLEPVAGWTGSILYSTGVGLVLKLFSSALQQKGIGQNLSHYVKVRQFVGINSTLMKAMRLVLGKDGLSVPKVSILIGGPGMFFHLGSNPFVLRFDVCI